MNRLFPAFAALLLAGCGYVGDPLPPLANVPEGVTDLAATQRGGNIVVQFSVPDKTTEGFPIPPPVRLDLRAGPAERFEENQWAAAARKIATGTIAKGAARYEIPAVDWTGREVILGVRAVAANGKQSRWSNFVVVPVVAPPEKPTGVVAVATQSGVRLTWQARGTDFQVFRKTDETEYGPVAGVQAPEWNDPATEFGKRYSYAVQAIAKLGNGKQAESEMSEDVSIVPRDTFPPAAPRGLLASVAPNSVELNWERNGEGDLKGYRVYRGEGSGAMAKIADVSVAPTFSDRATEHGKTYRYAVTALDQAGNESPHSAPVDVAVP